MSDIHFREIRKSSSGGKGEIQLIFHIPIVSKKIGIVPTPVSVLPGLQQTEIDALANGSLVEIKKNMIVLDSEQQSDIETRVSELWESVKIEYNSDYNFEQKFHGVSISASA